MSDKATTIALFAACVSSLSASLAFIAARLALSVAKLHDALAKEFWRQSVQQAEQNTKQWIQHQATSELQTRLANQHQRLVYLIFPDGEPPPAAEKH